MKLLFISSSITTKLEIVFNKNIKGASIQYASNTFQNSIIQGLYANQFDFSVLSFPGLPCFPHHYSDFYVDKAEYILPNGTVVGKSLSYCSCIVLKDFSIRYRTIHNVRKWIKDNYILPKDSFVVLTYQPSGSINGALLHVKKKYPNMIIATVIADYNTQEMQMQYAKENFGYIKRIQSYIEFKRMNNIIPKIDKYIVLTSAIGDSIPTCKPQNTLVLEGLIDDSLIVNKPNEKNSKIKTVVYTGQLSSNSGIIHLIDAFMQTKSSKYRLIITGTGGSAEVISEKSKIDNRIQYKGIVSKEEMIRLQREATLLVNPRLPSAEMTKYSFPSKIMEYMASGTPLLTYKLEGIPSDYYNYCYSIEDTSIESMSRTLDSILQKNQEELNKMGNDAVIFLSTNKTVYQQVNKLIDFLKL